MKKTAVFGYYGFGNAGDELILRSLLARLRKENGGDVVVLSNNPGLTAREHNVRASNRWLPWNVIYTISSCDLLIFGGGGLLQDVTSSRSLWYHLLILWIAITFRKKISVYAVGVGPFRRKFNERLMSVTLNRTHRITVRDEASKECLVRASCRKEIEVSRDPVLDLELPLREGARAPSRKVRIAVVPRKCATMTANGGGFSNETLIKDLSWAVSALAAKLNAEVHVISFHPVMDQWAVQRVLRGLGHGARTINWDSVEDLVKALSTMDFVISMRLHGVILSAMMKIPVVGVGVDPKISNFLRALSPVLEESNLIHSRSDAHEIAKTLSRCWEDREAFLKNVQEHLPVLRDQFPTTILNPD